MVSSFEVFTLLYHYMAPFVHPVTFTGPHTLITLAAIFTCDFYFVFNIYWASHSLRLQPYLLVISTLCLTFNYLMSEMD